MTVNEVLAEGVLQNKLLLGRYLAGFDATTAVRQAPGLPNHAVWSLGHCALTMHRAAEKMDGVAPAGTDFVEGSVGDEGRFGMESVAFGSTPTGDARVYPGLARSVAIYESACDRLAVAVRRLEPSRLGEEVAWGNARVALWALVVRMTFHNGMHTGQIADLRRALGLKSIFS